MFWFWFILLGYILPTIICFWIQIKEDRSNGTNSFEAIGYNFIPILNFVFSITYGPYVLWTKVLMIPAYLYYSKMTGTKSALFERKYNLTNKDG